MRNKILAVAALTLAGAISPTSWAKAPSPARLRLAAEAQQAPFLETLSQLVNIDSGSDDGPGLAIVAEYLSGRLADIGAKVERVAAAPSPGEVVIGTLKGRGKKSFLLLAHYDTVYPAGTVRNWPYQLENDKMHGPGVFDTKGGIAVTLSTLAVLKQLDFDDFSRVTVLFNPDEETGSEGSHELITRLASEHDFTLSAEPGGTQRLLATSGVAHLRMTVAGVPSHAGVAPEQGRNALVEASNVISQTRDWSQPERGLKFNWTIAQSGQKSNVIPDEAEASADIRYLDRHDVEALLVQLEGLTAKPSVAGTKVSFDLIYSRPPLLPTLQSRTLAGFAQDAGAEIGYPIRIVDTPFGGASDAAYAAASGKSAVVESFGLAGAGNHAIYKEYAERSSVVPAIYVMSRTMVRAGAAQ